MLQQDVKPTPELAVIRAYLGHITRRWHDLGQPVELELVFLTAEDKARVKHVSRFAPDETGLDLAADLVEGMNKHGVNAYAVVNPIDATHKLIPGERAKAEDIVASFYHWGDGDSAQAAENIKNFVGPKCTFFVLTGTTPSSRPHVYWELEEPTRNLTAWTATQKTIAATLKTDAAVVDPPRIMRIAGSVNWPKPSKAAKGYIAEVTTLRIYDPIERPPVSSERMARAFAGAAPQVAQQPAGAFQIDTGEHSGKSASDYADILRRARTDGEKHGGVRDLTASLAGMGVSRAMTEALVREACPVWDEGVEKLIDTAYAKFWRPNDAADEPARERASTFFQASDLAGQSVPPRKWLVQDLIPADQVTMLGGDGGVGKSLLALQLCAAVATDMAWIGRRPTPGVAVYLTAEDDRDEVHRRLNDICEGMGIGISSLRNLMVRSMAGEDALLSILNPKTGTLHETPLYQEVEAAIRDCGASLIVLDTLADLHSGQENDRANARQFIGLLRGLAIRNECTVVVLAHPSLTGISSGSGLSGSTAWNNSVRSRLYFERISEDGYEPDPDARRLVSKKSNYGRTDIEITVKWTAGAFAAQGADTGLDRLAAKSKAERVFLKLLREWTKEGRHVSPNSGVSYAPSKFAEDPRAEGCTSRALKTAMDGLFAAGKVKAEDSGPPSRRYTRLVEC